MINAAGIRWVAPVAAALCCAPLACHAQITLDGSLGAAGALAGPNYAITSGLGRQVGGNLFHSFGQFNVNTGQSATFSGPGSVTHIIGRVTGSAPSIVNGAIRTRLEAGGIPTGTLSTANLWLLNPNGMLFGPNAALDVGGSFHVSTADYLKLGSGAGAGYFHASLSRTSTLTSAAPSAFGFLAANPQPIIVQGSGLVTPRGATLSLVGGDIALTDDALVFAPGGRINVASVAGPGEISPAPASLDASPGTPLGAATLIGASLLTTDFTGGDSGAVHLRAGRLELLSGGNIDTTAYEPTGNAGPVRVQAAESVLIDGQKPSGFRSGIYAVTFGSGQGGDVAVAAPAVTVSNGGVIRGNTGGSGNGAVIRLDVGRLEVLSEGMVDAGAGASASGNGGSITVTAGEAVVVNGMGLAGPTAIRANTSGGGNAGTVTIAGAPRVTLDNGGAITAYTTGAGNAGTVDVAAGRLELSAGGNLHAGVRAGAASGQGGNLNVKAAEGIVVDGQPDPSALTGILADTQGAGTGGTVTIRETPSITLRNGGVIAARTFGQGAGGTVDVETGSLVLESEGRLDASTTAQGPAGKVAVRATGPIFIDGQVGVPFFTGILANTSDQGNAGDVSISGTALTVVNGGAIASTTTGSGDAGNVTVAVNTLKLQSGSWIMSGRLSADAPGSAGSGAGGTVTVTANGSILVDGFHPVHAVINSSLFAGTGGAGPGGAVTVTAPAITLSNGGAIQSFTTGTGAAGAVTVNAGRLDIVAGGSIDTSGSAGAGGTITVNAGSLGMTGAGATGLPSGIAADTSGAAPAGDIAVTASLLTMANGATIRSSTLGAGRAGSIRIAAGSMEMRDRALITVQSADGPIGGPAVPGGPAGSIAIDAGRRLMMSGGSRINARTESAPAGDIHIRAKELIYLSGSEISTSVAGGSGNGGNIFIDPIFVVLDDSRIIANALRGNGGNITIISDYLIVSGDSLIQASSQFGLSGTITTTAPDADVGAALSALPSGFFDASLLLRESCAARAGRASNSFTGVGRGGLPASPAQMEFGSYAEAPVGSGQLAVGSASGPLRVASAPAIGCLR